MHDDSSRLALTPEQETLRASLRPSPRGRGRKFIDSHGNLCRSCHECDEKCPLTSVFWRGHSGSLNANPTLPESPFRTVDTSLTKNFYSASVGCASEQMRLALLAGLVGIYGVIFYAACSCSSRSVMDGLTACLEIRERESMWVYLQPGSP